MAGVLTAGATLGVMFGLASFTLLQRRGVDPLIGIPLSLMAFFFGFAASGT